MRIGMDFDGTITKAPRFFANLSHNPEVECYVVTARPEKDREYVEGFLKNYDITVKGVAMITQDLAKADDRAYIETVFREKPRLYKELALEVAYEDDLRIINCLRKELPNLVALLIL